MYDFVAKLQPWAMPKQYEKNQIVSRTGMPVHDKKTLQNKIDSLEKAMEIKNETAVTIDVNTPESVENDS